MMRIERSTVLDTPVEVVWRLLRDFNAHESWNPAVTSSRIEAGEAADLVGSVRAYRLQDGAFLREQLIALSDRDMSLTSCLLEAPVALYGYTSTIRLRRVTVGERTFLQWLSRFDAPAHQAEALVRFVESLHDAGIAGLKARLRATPTLAPITDAASREPEVARASPIAPSSGAGPDAMDAMAIVVERYGGPEVLLPRRMAVPRPGPDEVRLRHAAIGVNMIDLHGRAGEFGLPILPGVPGMEAAGTVLDAGSAVRHLRPGDRVVYACPPPGAYAEARTMPAALLVTLPPDIDAATAAALFLKGITADLLLHDVHPLRAGETVLVHAAAGGLGLVLAAWARSLGARVIGAVSTDRKAEAAANAGCDRVVVSSRQDLGAEVMACTQGRGADVVFDGIGQASFDASFKALARRGHLVSHGQVTGPIGSREVDALVQKSIRLSRPNFAHFVHTPDQLAVRAGRLFDAIRRGIVRPVIDSRWPLREAAQAHARLAARSNIGSIILEP